MRATIQVLGKKVEVEYDLGSPKEFGLDCEAELALEMRVVPSQGLEEKLGKPTPERLKALSRAFEEQVLKPMFNRPGTS